MWLKVMKLLLDMLRRINFETDKDPIHGMLRSIKVVKSEETATRDVKKDKC